MAGGMEPSRRDVMVAPGLAALLSATGAGELVMPPAALAKIKATDVHGYTDMSGSGLCGVGGRCSASSYEAFLKNFTPFADSIKSGQGAPPFANTQKLFTLREEGGDQVMGWIVVPEADLKDALGFFVEKGPKANPLWGDFDKDGWKQSSLYTVGGPAFLYRGSLDLKSKGKWFGQYEFGFDGPLNEWSEGFSSADDFHNSLGIEASVGHLLDTKSPGNSYKTKAKNAINVFHVFNSLEGAKELNKFFDLEAEPFKSGPYKGPFNKIIWKVEDEWTKA